MTTIPRTLSATVQSVANIYVVNAKNTPSTSHESTNAGNANKHLALITLRNTTIKYYTSLNTTIWPYMTLKKEALKCSK